MFIGTADTFMGSIITCVVCGIVGVAIYAIMLVLLRVKEIMGFIPKRKR